jgi:glycosyltransferase involved in cell wall biosynthesis
LNKFLHDNFTGLEWRILVADNGSTDSTLDVAERLSQEYPRVDCVHLDQKGRGRALRSAWLQSHADIVSYMDVDLSTDLRALPELVESIVDGGYDVAMGSRLAHGAVVKDRSIKREITSRGYVLLINTLFWTSFSDVQCGFKALTRATVDALIPLVRDNAWFFDTELLLLALHHGFKIREVPVLWSDDQDSRVKVISTVMEDIKGLLRLRFGGIPELSNNLDNR